MYLVRQACANSVDSSGQGLHCLPLIQQFLYSILGSKLYLVNFQIKYAKELRCLTTKGKYGKVTDTEIKLSIISKSIMIDIFEEFIDQLIDYSINCASPWTKHG